MRKAIIAILVFAAVAGCVSSHEPAPMPVLTEPVAMAPEPQDNPGSLFDPNNAEFLYDDSRARRVGDIVLVRINEDATASQRADTTAERETDLNMGIQAFPRTGLLGVLPGVNALNVDTSLGTQIDSTATNNFEGTGETSRETSFTATVAARIVRILPGRVMQVEGARRVRINNETQILVVRGLVRARDIQADNSVPSTSLAEAQVEIYGEGILTDKQRPGWLSRILDNIFPF